MSGREPSQPLFYEAGNSIGSELGWELQLQALHLPGVSLGPGSVMLQGSYLSIIWAGLQWELASNVGFLMEKKSFRRYPQPGIWLACPGEDRTCSPAQLALINKALNPAFPLLLSFWQICVLWGAQRTGRHRGIPTPWTQEAALAALCCTQPASKAEVLRERGSCIWQHRFISGEFFSMWSQRQAVHWMMHNNGIASIGANSFLTVRKELWNPASKFRGKFLCQLASLWVCYKWLSKLWAE